MTIINVTKRKDYSSDTLEHLQNVQLMILKDFIEVCEKHKIEYFIDGGSLLGCIRHKGFIPWDDDIDVILFRDQYEKFLKYSKELTPKYDIINSANYEYYCRLYTKLSLKGTRNYDYFERNTDYTYGINIDIFVFDNIPNGKIKRNIFKLQYKIFKRTLFYFEITHSDIYTSKNKEKIGHILKFLLKLLNINNKKLKKWGNKLVEKSTRTDSNFVCNLSTSYKLDAFNKKIFNKSITQDFEELKVNVPKDYDEYLSIIYGDYMKLPPVDERINHGFERIDFGKY